MMARDPLSVLVQVLIGGMGARLPSIYKEGNMIYETLEGGDDGEDEDDGLHPEWSLARWGLAPG